MLARVACLLLTLQLLTIACTPGNGTVPGPVSTAGPVASGPPKLFETLPPGAQLPGTEECRARVRRSDFEPRPENREANNYVPRPFPISIDGASPAFNAKWAGRIDGNFTGTTDEIIQWASCKWGFDEDLMRARAAEESSWRQSNKGDTTNDRALCAVVQSTPPCAQSYGLFQPKASIHEGTYPRVAQSTAFNADYSLAWLRACFEGDFNWLGRYEAPGHDYAAGDVEGCTGAWFSGEWYNAGATSYLARVKDRLHRRAWEASNF